MDKNYTIYDLAAELGVTPSMVSRAFNPKARIAPAKREMILAAANRRGFEPNKFASRLSRETVRIGVLMVYKAEHVRDALLRGINEAYEKLRDYKIECEIKCISSSEKKAEQCREELFAFAEFDGVIVEGFGHSECTELINEFAKVNPNIVMLQNVCRDAKNLFVSKHDEELAARIVAELLRGRLNHLKKRNVLLVTGSVNSSIHGGVLRTFKEACVENGLNLVAHVDMNDDSDKAVALTEKYLERRSTVDGIYISSGNSTQLCDYVGKMKKDIALITTDVHEGIAPYIENGTVFASICQNFAEQGYLAFDNLIRYIVEKTEPKKVFFSETVPVFRANLHLYKNK